MRRFEVKLQRFLQVGEGLFFGVAPAGDIDLEALRDIPIPLAPYGSSERSLHGDILSQKGRVSLGLKRCHNSCIRQDG